jgi:hypothetical protein
MDPAMVQQVVSLNERLVSSQGKDTEAKLEMKGLIGQVGSTKIKEMAQAAKDGKLEDADERLAWKALQSVEMLFKNPLPM